MSEWTNLDVTAYAVGVGALAMIAALATVILYGAWLDRAKVWAALRRTLPPEVRPHAPRVTRRPQLRLVEAEVQPTREVA